MMSEGLIYFRRVQASPAHQLSCQQQHRNFVTVAHGGGGIAVDIDHLDVELARRRERQQLFQQLLAQLASWARIEQKTNPRGTQAAPMINGAEAPRR
jgi:hypothetical protein